MSTAESQGLLPLPPPELQGDKLYEVTLDIDSLQEDIKSVRQRMRESFYADLFLLVSQSTAQKQRGSWGCKVMKRILKALRRST